MNGAESNAQKTFCFLQSHLKLYSCGYFCSAQYSIHIVSWSKPLWCLCSWLCSILTHEALLYLLFCIRECGIHPRNTYSHSRTLWFKRVIRGWDTMGNVFLKMWVWEFNTFFCVPAFGQHEASILAAPGGKIKNEAWYKMTSRVPAVNETPLMRAEVVGKQSFGSVTQPVSPFSFPYKAPSLFFRRQLSSSAANLRISCHCPWMGFPATSFLPVNAADRGQKRAGLRGVILC